jgi:hypothetical protein
VCALSCEQRQVLFGILSYFVTQDGHTSVDGSSNNLTTNLPLNSLWRTAREYLCCFCSSGKDDMGRQHHFAFCGPNPSACSLAIKHNCFDVSNKVLYTSLKSMLNGLGEGCAGFGPLAQPLL